MPLSFPRIVDAVLAVIFDIVSEVPPVILEIVFAVIMIFDPVLCGLESWRCIGKWSVTFATPYLMRHTTVLGHENGCCVVLVYSPLEYLSGPVAL